MTTSDIQFEAAADAVVAGDVAVLSRMLREDPALATARSSKPHRSTLLHYVAANGVEERRQKTAANAVEIARVLLESRAEPDALADMYGTSCTTMSMLVSSVHPAQAGCQAALVEILLDYGAAVNGVGGTPPLITALAFGYRDAAEVLVARGADTSSLPAASALGRLDDLMRLLPVAGAAERHAATALAAQHGHSNVLRVLLDAGEDPNRYNPAGFHAHSTPLHQAVFANHRAAVRLLLERRARLDVKDTVYNATPLDWAVHGGRRELAAYLRGRGVPAIRPERSEDAPAVRETNERAFGSPQEARLVESLRHLEGSISLVAAFDGQIVGHVLFTPVGLEPLCRVRFAGLGPLAVRPEWQALGVGSALTRAGLDDCRREGYEAVVLVGHPEYYARFGFIRADAKGLTCEFSVPPDAFMVLELRAGALDGVAGQVRYQPEFARTTETPAQH